MKRMICITGILFFISLMGMTDRPRDPWVFRCVLDKQPRMVVIALHERLWLAYSATDCTLYKSWKGDVNFSGAVYNAIHGPQPTIRGEVWMDGNPEMKLPLFMAGPDGTTVLPRWRGYRIRDDRVWLNFEFQLPDGTVIVVRESPEVITSDDGELVFQRLFEVDSMPDGWQVLAPIDHTDENGNAITYLEQDLYRSEMIFLPGGKTAAAMDFIHITNEGSTSVSAVLPNSEGGE